jgi:ABC-type multidrug transport system fused ATPase/permease subunit
VAHRPETIGAVTRVIELGEGKVIFDGSPNDYFQSVGIERMVTVP